MGLTWEEAEVAALNRQEWRRSVVQYVHVDVGWIKLSQIKSNYNIKLDYIYSWNLTTTPSSVNLRSIIVYYFLMLPMLIKSYFEHNNIISRYNPLCSGNKPESTALHGSFTVHRRSARNKAHRLVALQGDIFAFPKGLLHRVYVVIIGVRTSLYKNKYYEKSYYNKSITVVQLERF